MVDTKKQKNSPLVFYILGLMVAIFFELYWIGNFPYDYFMLIGIGLVVLIMGYLAFDGIIKALQATQEIRQEQNELMIKAQKAIYLATKRNGAVVEKPSEPSDLSGLISQLTESNARLAKEVQQAVTVNQLVKANEELVRNVRDVIGQTSSGMNTISVMDTPPIVEAPTVETPIIETPIIEAPDPIEAPSTEEPPITETPESLENIPLDNGMDLETLMSDTSISTDGTPDTVLDNIEETEDSSEETIDIDNITLEELDDIDTTINDDVATAEAAVADASDNAEAVEAAADMERDPNTMLTPEEIANLFNNL